MKKLGVMANVQQPTDWCGGMVIMLKSNGTVRNCVDLSKLNASICHERHIKAISRRDTCTTWRSQSFFVS